MSQQDLKKSFIQKGKFRIVLGVLCLIAGSVGKFTTLMEKGYMTNALLITGIAFIILGGFGIVLAKKKV